MKIKMAEKKKEYNKVIEKDFIYNILCLEGRI
jgi:hypothetical protein